MPPERADIVIVGAGAAGLMAAIFAGRAAPSARIVLLDGARAIGAKILVAGGGRCNVTHFEVDETAYAGSSRHAIKKVLRSFDVPRTIEFFREIGVELKREETGKLFPVTDNARTVLTALLAAARDAGVEIQYPWRVESIDPSPSPPAGEMSRGSASDRGGLLAHATEETSILAAPSAARSSRTFVVRSAAGDLLEASRLILATGGRSLPKTGSDGHGYFIAQSLGHTITPRVFPALVPLLLQENHIIRSLSGIAVPATLELRSATGKRLISFTNSTLCTHFGLSGPNPLDISRYYLDAAPDGAALFINWLPGETFDSVDAELQTIGQRSVRSWLRKKLPERLAEAILDSVERGRAHPELSRDERRALARAITEMPLPITGDRGYAHAEVTAGGVPLSEIRLESMESRIRPGLHLIGEICDVDGRIGGFNFQWAWSSGYLAGMATGSRLLDDRPELHHKDG